MIITSTSKNCYYHQMRQWQIKPIAQCMTHIKRPINVINSTQNSSWNNGFWVIVLRIVHGVMNIWSCYIIFLLFYFINLELKFKFIQFSDKYIIQLVSFLKWENKLRIYLVPETWNQVISNIIIGWTELLLFSVN